jgi:hypothetical protein
MIKDYLGGLRHARDLCDANPTAMACAISSELKALISSEEARARQIGRAVEALQPLLHARHIKENR